MSEGPASPDGGSHESGEQSPRSNVREQDRYLPIANISRIMKKGLPANGKIAKDAKETVQECVSEFISFVTSEASDKCQREKRKTINGDDLLWAIATLGFEEYIDPLKVYLSRYRDMEGDSKGIKEGSSRKESHGVQTQNAQVVHRGSFSQGTNFMNSQEKLQEREHAIHELEMKMEEKDRELRAIKIDHEAAWAKEDLLREQNKELATFRRERDNSEAERIQHLKQICELQEHIQEKDRQFLELEEQNRAAQENILYRDEQLREAQAWCARLHETMQTEFMSRTENFNNCWLGLQRQFADMERHHLQTIQQLQLELGETREKSGIYTDESRVAHADAKDASQFVHNNGNQFNVHEGGPLSGNSEVPPNGNVENITPFVSIGNASNKTEYPPGVPLVPSSLLGMGAYLPPGQMTALHPFVMHQQGVPQSLPSAKSHVAQSQLGHFQQIPAIPSHQQWQNQQAVSEGSQLSNESQYLPSQTEENLLSSGAHYEYGLTANGHVLCSNYLDSHINPIQEPGVVVSASNEAAQVLETNDNSYLAPQQTQPSSEEGSGKFHEGSGLESLQQSSETQAQEEITVTVANHIQGESLTMKPQLPSDTLDHHNSSDTTASSVTGALLPEVSLSTRQMLNSPVPMKITEPVLLDERSLLACIVRAIPTGSSGQIRISSTLPNRLGKVLAPLHWHDYKKKYGKLDDFVASHPELFVIEGDFVHLREGAQEIISATAAVAKVAAAAAASTPYSSVLPSVAVTPMAQNQRLKKAPSIDTRSTILPSADLAENSSQYSTVRNQHSNGVGYNIVQGLSNVKILSKPKDSVVQNGFKSDSRPGHSSMHMAVANGTTIDRSGVPTYQNQGSSNGRNGTKFAGKNSGRASGAVMTSRK